MTPARSTSDHLTRIERLADLYRSRGVTVTEAQVLAALDLADAWRRAASERGIRERDIIPPLDDDALDTVVAASRHLPDLGSST